MKIHLVIPKRCFTVVLGLVTTGTLLGSTPNSGIEGVISISPTHGGPTRVGEADSKPLPNIEFVVANEKGVVTSFKTDDQGRFSVSLAPGHYTVSRKAGQPRIGRFGPFDVDVTGGQVTKVQWNCDSGMR